MIRLRFNLRTLEEKNIFYLSVEVFFTAILAAAQSFFQLFAIRLGASNTEISLLTSIPALFTIALSFPIGRFLQNHARPQRWIFGGLVMNRLTLGLIALVPFITLAGITQGTLVIAIMILAGIPLLFFNNGIYPIIMSLVPGERWAGLFTIRSVVNLITTAAGVSLIGQFLNAGPFPSNYQVMILIAVPLSLFSLNFWLKACPRPPQQPPAHPEGSRSFREQFRILDELNFRTDMGRVIFNQLMQYAGIWMATPLYVIYIVKSLGATEAWVGLNTTLISLSALVGSLLGRWVISRWGEPLTLKRFSQVASLYPILMGLSTSLVPVLLIGALNSLLSPAYSLSHNNNLLGSFPKGKEHEGIAIYNTLTSLGAFLFPLLGVTLANYFGIQPVLIGCGLLSLVGSISFWLWPVKGTWRMRVS